MECYRIRSYVGYRDGVWEVFCVRYIFIMIGIVFVGKLFLLNNGLLNVLRFEVEKDVIL